MPVLMNERDVENELRLRKLERESEAETLLRLVRDGEWDAEPCEFDESGTPTLWKWGLVGNGGKGTLSEAIEAVARAAQEHSEGGK